ncbi:response regulator [Mucilaginibacter mali]|uniref:histidine kinase n=1 Tax=Mucilaginibacter mali TaxID=2740462 RepID=A0A7D4U8X4_9SPHI|nr:two-component regulator propeller domain-containing protein [Mucilaginibacter mali]QKJ28558.1 response regulator [Mucilaginibacter mali]
MKRITIFLFLLSLAPVFSIAQPYYFRHYQVEDGLPYNSVLCSLQDKQGFMWFGTRDGLCRFDGYLFKSYKYTPGNKFSLGNNYVYNLTQDDPYKLWIGTKNGLYRFDMKLERFELETRTAGKIIDGIVIDEKHNVWFIASGKLYCITHDGHFQTIEIANAQRLTAIARGSVNELWLATESGYVVRFASDTWSFKYYDVFANTPAITARRIEKIWKDGAGHLYIGTSNHGVKLLNIADITYKDILTFDEDHTEIMARAFCPDGNGHIWIGTESGIYIYDTTTGSIRNLRKNFYDPYSLSDNAVYTITKDSEKGMWISTYFGGVNYYSATGAQFEKFFPKDTPGSLHGNLVREFCQDTNGYLWVGTEDAGLNRLNLRDNTFTHVGFTGKPGSISYNNIHGLLSVGKELWVGTYQHGLDILDINSLKVIRHYGFGPGEHDLKTNFVNVLFKTRSGQIYLGTQLGLYRYNQTGDNFTHVNELGVCYVSSIIEDHSGKIWVGTFGNGVYTLSPQNEYWTHFEHQPDVQGTLTSNVVTDVYEDSSQRIWLCTENGGLCQYNIKQAGFTKYKLPAEFNDKYLFNVIEDNKRRLWVTSSGGLICMEPAQGNVHAFTKGDGLLNDQFNYRSAFKDSQGRLYFGSSKGFIRHWQQAPVNAQTRAQLYITGLQADHQTTDDTDDGQIQLPYAGHVTLGPGKTTFSIDFSALSYASPGTAIYSYKIDGLDKNWITLPANRRVYYTQVAPGDYVFKVRASVGDNGVQTPVRTLKISITPPFYAGLPATIFYMILVCVAIYFVYKLLHDRSEEKNRRKIAYLETQKEREIYQAKIDFFTHVTHEIRTPLSLIKAPLEKVMQADDIGTAKNDLMLVNRNTDRLLDLVDQLLSFRRTEIDGYSLNFNRTNISALLINLCALFREQAQQAKLDLQIDVTDSQLIAYIDHDAFNKILSNLLSNAIKYADSRMIVRLLKENEDEFCIIVKNDGPVLSPDTARKIFEPFVRGEQHSHKPGTGIGLPLAKALVDLHQGKLEYLAEQDQLNTFKLVIPLHQAVEMNIGPDNSGETSTATAPEIETEPTKPVVLIVEDQPDFREFIQSLLSEAYSVLTAGDAAHAKEILIKHSVQLIISDVMMPGIDGFEFCRQLKSDINFSHIPFILLTAKNNFASKIEGLDCGSDAFIEKPFSPRHLKMQIVNLLKNRDIVKEHYAHSPVANLKTMAHSKADSEFLHKLDTLIKVNLTKQDFDVEELAEQMNLSRPTLYRKVKAITDLSPAELVTVTRLKQAAEMLTTGDYKIYEIAEEVGFTSSAVLSRAFQKQFGVSPSVYISKTLKS